MYGNSIYSLIRLIYEGIVLLNAYFYFCFWKKSQRKVEAAMGKS